MDPLSSDSLIQEVAQPVFELIAQEGGITAQEIADRLLLPRPAVAIILRRLVASGHLDTRQHLGSNNIEYYATPRRP